MFGPAYSEALPFDRVKYGCLNTSGDEAGVNLARRYGDCHFILRESVRTRTTITNHDSAGFHPLSHRIGTSEHYAHIMQTFTNSELKAALEVGTGLHLNGISSGHMSTYKEIQIHGPLKLSEHIEALVIPFTSDTPALRALAGEFSRKFGIKIIWLSA